MSNLRNYLTTREKSWTRTAEKTVHQLHAQTIWGFDKFETSKVQWKAVGVPKLTYANAVLTPTDKTRRTLERQQSQAGKWAMGIPNSKVASEFVEGELGWSSFEAREAQSKIRYFHRVQNMEEYRWPKVKLNMMSQYNIETSWIKRVHALTDKYDCKDIKIEETEEGFKMHRKFQKDVKRKVSKQSEEMWRRNMQAKKSLEIYRGFKTTKGLNHRIYHDGRSSALLALARAGFLATRIHRRHREPNWDCICMRCGMQTETTTHVVFQCNDLYYTDTEYAQRLGLTQDHCHKRVADTKRHLLQWEVETSTIC
jgi:hypothetical protein